MSIRKNQTPENNVVASTPEVTPKMGEKYLEALAKLEAEQRQQPIIVEDNRIVENEYIEQPQQGGRQARQDATMNFYQQLSGVNEFLGGGMWLTTTNEVLSKVENTFNEVLNKNQKIANSVALLQYTGDNVGAFYPMIIFGYKVYNERRELSTVSYSVVIIETEETIEPEVVTSRGRQYELPRAANDSFNGYVKDDAAKVVFKEIAEGNANVSLVFAGVSVLYRETLSSSENAPARVLDGLLRKCVSAITEETILTDNPVVNLGDAIRNTGTELIASIDTRIDTITSVDGIPVKVDTVVTTKELPNQQRRNNANYIAQHTAKPIGEVGVVFDLIRAHGLKDALYLGNTIITYTNNPCGLQTLASSLLAIAAAMIVQSDEVYPEMLRPNRTKENTLGDFGAVGYELVDSNGNAGSFDINSAEFTNNNGQMFRELVKSVIYPDLIMSIDIPEVSLTSIPVKAIEKTVSLENKMDCDYALNYLFRTIDELTLGEFGALYNFQYNVLSPTHVLIPLGYWIDARGNKRDLREINYIAALDYSGRNNNPDFILEWSDTFGTKDPRVGAAKRLELMGAIVGANNIYVKGYAYRYTFNGDFVTALAEACQRADVAPSFNNLSQSERSRYLASYDAYSNYTINRSNVNAFVSNSRGRRGYNDVINGRGYRTNMFSR